MSDKHVPVDLPGKIQEARIGRLESEVAVLRGLLDQHDRYASANPAYVNSDLCQRTRDALGIDLEAKQKVAAEKARGVDPKRPVGYLWWSASNLAEARQWEHELTAKGAQVVKIEQLYADQPKGQQDFIFMLNKDRAASIIGQEPGEEEWLELSPFEVVVDHFDPSGNRKSRARYKVAALYEDDAVLQATRYASQYSDFAHAGVGSTLEARATSLPDEELFESVCRPISRHDRDQETTP